MIKSGYSNVNESSKLIESTSSYNKRYSINDTINKVIKDNELSKAKVVYRLDGKFVGNDGQAGEEVEFDDNWDFVSVYIANNLLFSYDINKNKMLASGAKGKLFKEAFQSNNLDK